jgi:hypothetical protein
MIQFVFMILSFICAYLVFKIFGKDKINIIK